ncbi:MAG: ChbG/HpnK family deacetylase [Flavisolibacter sp.]
MKLSLFFVAMLFNIVSFGQTNKSNQTPVLIRCDDIGMCHAVNEAARKVLETGIPVSMSVMVPCSWFPEAVELLKKYPNVSVGVHLVLNSEWRTYRWGPVAGAGLVPSLVDSVGLFFPTRDALFKHDPTLPEVEKELRAQIEKALKSGLKIDYLDYHMGAAVSTPETRAIVEKLASEYKLAISRYYNEEEVAGWYPVAPANKLDTMLLNLRKAEGTNPKLMVCHIGLETPEMNALEDVNPFGPKDMSKHRNAELNSLLSPQLQQLIHEPKYRLVNYGMLKKENGLNAMQRPKLL